MKAKASRADFYPKKGWSRPSWSMTWAIKKRYPEVVDIAFDVLERRLADKGVDLPTTYGDERLPADPDYLRLLGLTAIIAVVMTVLIAATVLWVQHVAVMTTVIVGVSIAGAAAFMWGVFRLQTPVVPTETAAADHAGPPSGRPSVGR